MQEGVFRKEFYAVEGEILSLRLIETSYGVKEGELPYYYWTIVRNSDQRDVGSISLRIGHNFHSYYNGNIGYEIDEPCRGHHYALTACRMVVDLARKHGMDRLYLTCNFDNHASYKTIESLGGELLEEVMPPKEYIFYYDGMKKHKIYLLKL